MNRPVHDRRPEAGVVHVNARFGPMRNTPASPFAALIQIAMRAVGIGSRTGDAGLLIGRRVDVKC